MANAWLQTVAETQRRARKRLPPSVYRALIAGSGKGLTLSDNIAAFSELGDQIEVPPASGRPAQTACSATRPARLPPRGTRCSVSSRRIWSLR